MEIEQYLWGASAEGEGILLYTLRCAGGREVRLSNAGAAVTGIFAAGADGRPEALTPVFETPEALLADYADRGKTLCANRYGFGQRIWQSRVETDRIVMELPAGDDELPALAVLFDLDDDGQFAVTHLARGATAAPFTMTTQLFWQGDWRPTLRTQRTTKDASVPSKDGGGTFWAKRHASKIPQRAARSISSRRGPKSASSGTTASSPCCAATAVPHRSTTKPSTAKKTSTGSERTIPPPKTASPQDAVFSFRSDSKVGKRIREDRNTIDYQCIDSG